MSSESEPYWGQASFDRDQQWYGRLSASGWDGNEKARYQEARQAALANPEVDLFAEFMPTNRPKHDIGRYVMKHAISVPLIGSLSEWQSAIWNDSAMLRSEHPQDYAGLSGLYSSEKLRLYYTHPRDEHGLPDEHNYEQSDDRREWILKRRYEGPLEAKLSVGNIETLNSPFGIESHIGTAAVTSAISDILRTGLYDGSINPAAYMRLRHWDQEHENHFTDAQHHRYKHSLRVDMLDVSRWKYIPGINIRIFKDNIIEGKYFIGGRDAHHHWEVTDGADSPDVEAHDKAGYRGRATHDSLQYTLPAGRIIELYEKVRTLPYFDQTQAPMMEMQYGEDGQLHFLQYLKTGLKITDTEEFALPSGSNVVTSYDVRGATVPEGEKMRIYLDPKLFTRGMRNQGFFDSHNMSVGLTSPVEQIAAMSCRAMIMNTMLSFKDNHWSSAPLYRAPVTIGTWNGEAEVEKRFNQACKGIPFKTVWEEETEVSYIDAIITSNGRAATVESDWERKTERIS